MDSCGMLPKSGTRLDRIVTLSIVGENSVSVQVVDVVEVVTETAEVDVENEVMDVDDVDIGAVVVAE
ncbi:MAG: hypothetical protein ABSB29_09600 [Nitrososphaerales archaeon]